ncbi:endophilin-a2 [Phtheirospermum japonicum]|uniref:Endophilin-a2 n=1 Tax=Phtheirospermum japonicum TaxID=374723 RepID=A0A830BEB1_9LAMI|nr:endophilin-a2 [Phtheirospermum japonicum]
MEAIRKQASRLREQVARQQQAVLKQFGAYGASDVVADDAELQQHQKLEKLYISTRAAKVTLPTYSSFAQESAFSLKLVLFALTFQHFQRDIVRGVEGYIVTGSKQVEIGTKLSEDSRKYGVENTCTSGSTLSKAASNFARSRAQMEKERGNLLKAFGTQVAEPLRAMVMGAPLEDARHLAQRYDRMRQEAEAQVEAERAYHQRVLQILDQLEGEVLYSYQAESDVELNLSIGDYVVVRKVVNNGWAEGECKGKAGWFPFGYIERRDRVLASKVAEVF